LRGTPQAEQGAGVPFQNSILIFNEENNMKTRRSTLLFTMFFVVVLFTSAAFAVGKKYAVTVGVNNYPNKEEQLQGAVTDARNMKNLLITKFGFAQANVTMLLDDQATRAAIIQQIKTTGNMVGAGDLFVFHYSGHGSLFPDKYSDVLDETDQVYNEYLKDDGSCCQKILDYYDSTIVPWDHESRSSGKNWGNEILDDELYDLFSAITAKGATVVFISDSCHSGTIGKAQKGPKMRFLSTEKALGVKHFDDLKLTVPTTQQRGGNWNMYNRYIVLSGARDDEYASDGDDPIGKGGLFTSTLVEVITRSRAPLTYRELMRLVGATMTNYRMRRGEADAQHPQLDIRFGNGDWPLFVPLAAN
jgi:hypothetical protein